MKTQADLDLETALKFVQNSRMSVRSDAARIEELLRRYDEQFEKLIEENRILRVENALLRATQSQEIAVRERRREALKLMPIVDRTKPLMCACGNLYTVKKTGPIPKSCSDCRNKTLLNRSKDYRNQLTAFDRVKRIVEES